MEICVFVHGQKHVRVGATRIRVNEPLQKLKMRTYIWFAWATVCPCGKTTLEKGMKLLDENKYFRILSTVAKSFYIDYCFLFYLPKLLDTIDQSSQQSINGQLMLLL